jgi:hypothetical protein
MSAVDYAAKVKKAIAAAVAFATALVADGVISGSAGHVVAVVVAVLGTLGVYAVKNAE